MNSEEKIKKLIEESTISTDTRTEKKILSEAMEHLDKLEKQNSPSSGPDIWRTIMKSPMTKFAAAAVVLCAFGLLIFFGNGNTLYAQVNKAIENANTIYAISKDLNNGEWEKGAEIWYDNNQGVIEIEWQNGEKLFTRIDNGRYMWEHRMGNNYARRSKTVDPIGMAKKLLNTEAFKERANRASDKDKNIDGKQCAAYIQSNPENSYQILSWLDDNNRVRGWEKSHLLDNGQWETYRIGQVKYNIEITPEVFTPDFGRNVKIVELDDMLDLYSDLDEALFTREELGLKFAVHELKLCSEGVIFAVTSIRPTDATKKTITSRGSAVWDYGSYNFGTAWKRLDNYGRGRAYAPIELGEIYHAGLQVKWTLFFPQGFEPEGPKECEFEVYLSTTGELREQRTKQGLTIKQRFKSMAILPLPKEQTTLKQVLDNTYTLLFELEPYAARDVLTLKSIPFTDEEMEEYIKSAPDSGETIEYRSGDRSDSARIHHGQSSKPGRISKEDWMKDRMDYLSEIENDYKESLKEVEKREQQHIH